MICMTSGSQILFSAENSAPASSKLTFFSQHLITPSSKVKKNFFDCSNIHLDVHNLKVLSATQGHLS